MKMTFAQADLLSAVTTLQRLAAQRGVYPVLANILLDAAGGSIQMTATDLEVAVRLRVPGTVLETGTATVPARKLADLVRELPPNEAVLLEGDPNHRLQLTCGRGTFRMVGLPPQDFPRVELSAEKGFSVEASRIRKMLTKTRFAASKEETPYFLGGVYFHLSPQWMRFVATDSRRLAVSTYPLEGVTRDEKGALLPLKAVDEILHTFSDGEEIRIAFHERFVVLGNERATLTSRLLEGEYPPYQTILSQVKAHPVTLRAPRDGLLKVLSRVGVFANPRTLGVRLAAKEGVLRVSAHSADFGEANDELDVEMSEPIQIAFNVAYLEEAIKAVETEFVRLFLKDPVSAVVVRPDDDTDYLCLVMPMRIEE